MNFIISPRNALLAVPHNGMHDAVSSCGYSFPFNLEGALVYRHVTYVNYEVTNAKCLQIDSSAAAMPVTHVDKENEQLPSAFKIKRLKELLQVPPSDTMSVICMVFQSV